MARYAATKARFRRLIEERLRDEAAESVSLTIARQVAHRHGGDAYLGPILRDMQRDGLIEVWTEGRTGVIYFTPKWRRGKG